MGIPSYLAVLLETGASTNKGKSADPRMIRYETSIYPENAGVELLVSDLEDFRLMATLQEPRLAVYLEALAISIDLGLATKASESGKMLNRLQQDQQIQAPKATNRNTDDDKISEMNNSESKQDIGNKKYQN